MTFAIPLLALAVVFVMIGQHAQRSVGGRDFYIAALVCVLIAGGAFIWSMNG